MAKTVDDFLNSVKITAVIPENQALMTAARILSFADEEIQNELIPALDALNQEYFVTLETEAMVSGTDSYSIPYRAIGRKLRDLKITDGTTVRNVTQMKLEDAHLNTFQGSPTAFYYFGDKIKVVPTPNNSTTSLQKFYLFRPGQLVQTSAAGLITGISGTSITVSTVPSTFVSGVKVDFIQGTSGYSTLAFDQTISNVAGTTLTITTPPTGLAVGDYVAIKEQTPVVQFPDEAYSYLVQRTAKRVLEAISDFEGAKVIGDRLPQAKRNLQAILAPRIEGEGIKIINRNGLIRGNRNYTRYFRGNVS